MPRFIEDVLEHGFIKTGWAEVKAEIETMMSSSSIPPEVRGLPPEEIYARHTREQVVEIIEAAKLEAEEHLRIKRKIEAMQQNVFDLLRQAVVVVADNVAEYVFVESGKSKWDETADFPCLSPPFKNFWIEMKLPHGFDGGDRPTRFTRTAYHFRAYTPDELVVEAHESVVVNIVGRWRDIRDAVSCYLEINGYWDVTEPFGPTETYYLPIDEHGTPLAPLYELHADAADEEGKREQAAARWFMAPALLAISFMHCKNVEIVENEPPAKLQKARMRRGKKPLISWKTLNITPMQKVLKTEGEIETAGIKRALHICRGHFKNFRDKGLFGRHKGLYWWDSQVRGRVTEGVVVKDYAVKKSA